MRLAHTPHTRQHATSNTSLFIGALPSALHSGSFERGLLPWSFGASAGHRFELRLFRNLELFFSTGHQPKLGRVHSRSYTSWGGFSQAERLDNPPRERVQTLTYIELSRVLQSQATIFGACYVEPPLFCRNSDRNPRGSGVFYGLLSCQRSCLYAFWDHQRRWF